MIRRIRSLSCASWLAPPTVPVMVLASARASRAAGGRVCAAACARTRFLIAADRTARWGVVDSRDAALKEGGGDVSVCDAQPAKPVASITTANNRACTVDPQSPGSYIIVIRLIFGKSRGVIRPVQIRIG
jgi:hypothetical protein